MVSALAPRSLAVRARLQRRDFHLEVDFLAEPGITILFGPSGAGKSTLLDCITGLVTPDEGEIFIGARQAFSTKHSINRAPQSRHVGYLFQSAALFPHLTVKRNVEYGILDFLVGPRESAVREILQLFHVGNLADRMPAQLSGGEAQRVALARSLVTNPSALLLDEPLSALDAGLKNSIIADLRAWNAVHEIPILYVTHDRAEVDALGERVITMDQGKIIQQGTPREVLEAPRHSRLAQIAGFENVLEGTIKEIRLDNGVMRVALGGSTTSIEVPLAHAKMGDTVRVAIRAGDILLALERPVGVSARNILHGAIDSLEQRSATIVCRVNAGALFEVHVTLGAARDLHLQPGREVWLVLKTYSCHVVA
jgi:molybdate transport system ATP-binding protein